MLGSHNKFFYQSKMQLKTKREQLVQTLVFFDIKNIYEFMDAFDYFCQNPHKYDGATIVKDLYTIRGLDACAMLHDYKYIRIANWWSLKGLISKLKADFNFGRNMEITGKGIFTPYLRTLLLWLSTPFYYLFKI